MGRLSNREVMLSRGLRVRPLMRRWKSEYVLAKVVDGKLVEAELKCTVENAKNLAQVGSASVLVNGEEFVTPIEQINPLLSENQEGFVRYTSHKKNSDWFGYIGKLPLGKTGDKQGMVKDVIFKPKHSQIDIRGFDKSQPVKFDLVGRIDNPEFKEAVNVTVNSTVDASTVDATVDTPVDATVDTTVDTPVDATVDTTQH